MPYLGGVSEAKINPLFISQKHCIRILFVDKEKYIEKHRTAARTRPRDLQMLGPDFFKLEHTKPLFNSNGILTVHNLHSYQSLLSISKILSFILQLPSTPSSQCLAEEGL